MKYLNCMDNAYMIYNINSSFVLGIDGFSLVTFVFIVFLRSSQVSTVGIGWSWC